MDVGNLEGKRIKTHTWSSGLDKCGEHGMVHWPGSTEGTMARCSYRGDRGWVSGLWAAAISSGPHTQGGLALSGTLVLQSPRPVA